MNGSEQQLARRKEHSLQCLDIVLSKNEANWPTVAPDGFNRPVHYQDEHLVRDICNNQINTSIWSATPRRKYCFIGTAENRLQGVQLL